MSIDLPQSGNQRTISVVICAYTEKRWDMIVAAVQSILRQTIPVLDIVLCIDHNQVLFDRCALAIEGWSAETDIEFTLILNDTGGHQAVGRTMGIEATRGDIVAFLDDDAEADPDWLEWLIAPYEDERVVAVGGAPLPIYAAPRPAWFPPQLDWTFGCYYDGLPTELGETHRLIGANMSARRSSLQKIGGLHADGLEDLELCHRLAFEIPGSLVLFEPRAIVHHNVVAERVTWAYVWRRCFYVNKSKAAAINGLGLAADTTADRSFVLGALSRSARAALRDTAHGDFNGVSRFAVLVTSVTIAVAGYSWGVLMLKLRPQAARELQAASHSTSLDPTI